MSRENGKHTEKVARVECQTDAGSLHTDGAWWFVKGNGSDYVFAVCDQQEVANRISDLLNAYGLVGAVGFIDK
jgi:hypothetical protein